MPAGDELYKRMRSATNAELEFIARILDKKTAGDRPVDVVNLSRELRSASGHTLGNAFRDDDELPYRDILALAVQAAADRLGWSTPEIPAAADDRVIEEYVFAALKHFHDAARASMTDAEKARERERIVKILESTSTTFDAKPFLPLGAFAAGVAGVLLGLPAALPAGLAMVALRRMNPSAQKVLNAVVVLIHTRKRTELEERLRTEFEAAT